MVKILPAVDKGATSIKPTVPIVITVMYKASRNPKSSIIMYPNVPTNSKEKNSPSGISSPLKYFRRLNKYMFKNKQVKTDIKVKFQKLVYLADEKAMFKVES